MARLGLGDLLRQTPPEVYAFWDRALRLPPGTARTYNMVQIPIADLLDSILGPLPDHLQPTSVWSQPPQILAGSGVQLPGTLSEEPPKKKKRRKSAYNKRYGKAFKRLAPKYKKKNGSWKKDGFKRCAAAARREAKK